MAKLTKKDIEQYKKKLLEEQARITGDVSSMEKQILNNSQRDSSGDLSGYSMHLADMGSDNFEREFTLDLMKKEQEILYEIQDAIERIENGTFGKCEMCGQDINKTRLKARAYARYCVECKENLEKKKK
ncbi:TraR/DksA C4-type zinc finger protein [bacterium]|jgi:RNA polymerase-binding transcription factor DksA|nr:TraR/DksA C4-type zinc finger protein [bacterium]